MASSMGLLAHPLQGASTHVRRLEGPGTAWETGWEAQTSRGSSSRTAAPSCLKGMVEVVQASNQDASWGLPGLANWKETLRWTQNSLEGFLFPSGLHWDPPQEELDRIAEERDVWKSLLDWLPPQPSQDKHRTTNGWMDAVYSKIQI